MVLIKPLIELLKFELNESEDADDSYIMHTFILKGGYPDSLLP